MIGLLSEANLLVNWFYGHSIKDVWITAAAEKLVKLNAQLFNST